jgi:ankyrin repeat protein
VVSSAGTLPLRHRCFLARGVKQEVRFGTCFLVNNFGGRGKDRMDSDLLFEALHDAVSSGQAEEVRRLILEEGADVTRTRQFGQTLLQISAQGPDLEVSRALLEAGADVDACDECMGYGALQWAIYFGQEGQTRLLLDAGADFEARDSGERPLILAARDGGERVVAILLDAGADAAAADYDGRTALHAAAKNCDVGTARLLLNAGANAGATDDFGWTPRYSATQPGRYWAETQPHPYVAPEALPAMVAMLEAAEQDRSTAFAMGLEERLGAASWVRALDPGVVRMVLEFEREVVILPTPAGIW